jgi:hypothetical protein
MASYKVVSDLVAGKNPGDTITDEELLGVNVEALIEAGHIAGETTTKNKAEKEN